MILSAFSRFFRDSSLLHSTLLSRLSQESLTVDSLWIHLSIYSYLLELFFNFRVMPRGLSKDSFKILWNSFESLWGWLRFFAISAPSRQRYMYFVNHKFHRLILYQLF